MDNVVLIFITLMASTVSIICIRYNIRLRNYLKVFIEISNFFHDHAINYSLYNQTNKCLF